MLVKIALVLAQKYVKQVLEGSHFIMGFIFSFALFAAVQAMWQGVTLSCY